MDPLLESLVRLQSRLDNQGIPSALIGGLTLSIWGRARATKDLDLKILLRRDQAKQLLIALGDEYKPIQRAPLESLRRNGVVFVRDHTGTRIDLLVAESGFDQQVMGRARMVQVSPGIQVRVATAEDMIVYKLIATRLLDQADAETVIRAQGNALDDRYIIKTLREFEKALDDSTLVATYQKMRKRF